MLTRGVFPLLCDLKRFQIITGNKDHSAIIRTKINRDEPFYIKS